MHRTGNKNPYVISKFSDVNVYISDDPVNKGELKPEDYETLRKINFYNPDKNIKTEHCGLLLF